MHRYRLYRKLVIKEEGVVVETLNANVSFKGSKPFLTLAHIHKQLALNCTLKPAMRHRFRGKLASRLNMRQ